MKINDAPIPDSARMRQVYGAKAEKLGTETVNGMLTPGQMVKGRVVGIDASGVLTVETELGSLRATAASVMPVGRELLFHVVRGGATPLLAESGKANAAFNLLRVILPEIFGPGGGASGLTQEETVRAFWEGQALDGKPDPVKLAKNMVLFSQNQPPVGKSFSPGIAGNGDTEILATQKLGRLIEAHTNVNQTVATAGADSDYVIFPVFFAEQAGKGEWLYSYEGREGGGDDSGGATATLSFYLAMSRLGDTHITLTARPQLVSGVVTLASEDAAEHIRQHLPLLVQAIEKLTGAVTAITCRSGPVDCFKALKDELTSRLGLMERFALVDTRA